MTFEAHFTVLKKCILKVLEPNSCPEKNKPLVSWAKFTEQVSQKKKADDKHLKIYKGKNPETTVGNNLHRAE